MAIHEPQVLVIELGGQLTQKIPNVLREHAKVRSAVLTPKQAETWLKKNIPKAIILSGSAKSVNDPGASTPPKSIFSIRHHGMPIPILGICYGMQYLAKYFRGAVRSQESEYGNSTITVTPSVLFRNTPVSQTAWMSHGDSVVDPGQGFKVLGRSSSGALAAMVNLNLNIWGVQFHPEAKETEYGPTVLTNFVRDVAGCEPDWQPGNLAAEIQGEVLDQIGNDRVIVPWSGGVDSTVLVWILSRALGHRLRYFTIDANQLRKGELDEIRSTARLIGGDWRLIHAHEEFARLMAEANDGRTIRQNFQTGYGKILDEQAREFWAGFIAQGTLAPDMIESGKTGGAEIVQHHNDLEISGLKMLHPMRHMFKYEVRRLAQELGLPEHIYNRQPFPGPGLYVRIIGGKSTRENIDILRWADWQATEIIKKHGLYDQISQLVVGLDLTLTSGVKGDGRYSGYSVIIRPFVTHDFMTGECLFLPEPVVRELSTELTKHRNICRTWFDYTSKPSGRTELL